MNKVKAGRARLNARLRSMFFLNITSNSTSISTTYNSV